MTRHTDEQHPQPSPASVERESRDLSVPGNNSFLTRRQVGAALRAVGYPVADKTLATMASRGGGPAYRRFGARVLYRWAETLAWAEGRLSAPISSTSEDDT